MKNFGNDKTNENSGNPKSLSLATISVVTGGEGANGGNCSPPQPARGQVLRLIDANPMFSKIGGRGLKQRTNVCVSPESKSRVNAVSVKYLFLPLPPRGQSIATNSGADSIGHGGIPWAEEQQTRNWSNCTDHYESARQND